MVSMLGTMDGAGDPDDPDPVNRESFKLQALRGRAANVMFACERAVELAPSVGSIRDSRGLARALTGDRSGAIADFAFFVEQLRPGHPTRVEREAWIVALRAGRDPFTPAVLERLRT